MRKTTTALETPLREQLDRLAAFEPGALPVVSLYLDMRADQHGRANYDTFLRKAFPERLRTLDGAARASVERDYERIARYLGEQVRRSANGLAIFACAGQDAFFEAVQLDVPVGQHTLHIGPAPHLFPLARLNDQHPRYAALLVDTNAARLFVFGLGATESTAQVSNVKTRKSMTGGWSQARYQRHLSNFHLHHMKEVVAILDRTVRDEAINQIIVSCDEVSRPTLMEHLPPHLVDKIVDAVNLDIRTPDHQVLAATMEALREKDADTDAERVERMLNAWRAGGLAVAGVEDTRAALELGQVEELLITATPDRLRTDSRAEVPADSVDEILRKAQQTSARIRFIEDAALLDAVGGVGAILRFKL